MRAALGVALLVLGAGCLELERGRDTPPCAPEQPAVFDLPFLLDKVDIQEAGETDPRQPWDALLWLDNQSSPRFEAEASSGWTLTTETLAQATNASSLVLVRLDPHDPQPDPPEFTLDWEAVVPSNPECIATAQGRRQAKLLPPEVGDVAVPGKGVHVWTAGFWENGTLFYTNIPSIDRGPWPRAGWYAWEGGEPLPVYVYERDSTERPEHWAPCATVAALPPPLNECRTEGTLGEYFTTIAGFNEALQELSGTTARVTWMPPEKAYTRPGKEDHPLYGDALIFYIVIERVVDVPCPPALYEVDLVNACHLPSA